MDVDIGSLTDNPPSKVGELKCGNWASSLFLGSPAASSSAAIEAACPTHSVMTSFFTYCMVS